MGTDRATVAKGMAALFLMTLLIAVSGALHGAQTFGDVNNSANTAQSNRTWLSRHAAPQNGVVTGVTVRLDTAAASTSVIGFKHLRPNGGNSFTLIAQSPTYKLETGVQNYPVSFTGVLTGDRFGYWINDASSAYRSVGGESCHYYLGNHSSGSVNYTNLNSGYLPMQMTILAVGTGQGFGDSSLAANLRNGWTFVSPHTCPANGEIKALTLNLTFDGTGGGQPVVTFKHLRRVGASNDFTLINTSATFWTHAGIVTYPVDFNAVLAGDYIGYYITGDVFNWRNQSGQSCFAYGTNHASGTVTYTPQSNRMAVISGVVYAAGAVEVFGSNYTNTGSQPNYNTMYISNVTATRAGTVTSISINLGYASSTAQIGFRHYRNAGGNSFTVIAQAPVHAAQSGLTSYAVNFPNVQVGDYFGYWANGFSAHRGWTGINSWNLSGNHQSGTMTYNVLGNQAVPLAVTLIDDVAVSGTVTLNGGYLFMPQGFTLGSTLTKSGGLDFVTGMTMSVTGAGLTPSITAVPNANTINVNWTATRQADASVRTYQIFNGAALVATGTITVAWPQQTVAAREVGSVQEPPRSAAVGANGVYLHNGEFRHDLPILSIPGRVLPLGFGVTYRSGLQHLGGIGAGWTASFDRRLYYFSATDSVDLRSGDGRIDTFNLASGGAAGQGPYVKAGFAFTISRSTGFMNGAFDDVYTFQYAHGSTSKFTYVHKDQGNLDVFRETEFADRYNNKIVSVYNYAGALTELRGDLYDAGTPSRYRITFEYGTDGRLRFARDYADYSSDPVSIVGGYTGVREWEFVYNNSAQLTEIKLPRTKDFYSETKGATYRTRVQFTYDASDNLIEVVDARQANESSPLGWLKNNYNAGGAVDYQDVGRTSAGDTTHRQHIVYGAVAGNGEAWVDVVNAENFRSGYRVQVQTGGSAPLGTLVKVRHYSGTWTSSLAPINSNPIHAGDPSYLETQYEYDSEFHVTKITYPRGNRTEFRYDITNPDKRAHDNLLRVLSHPGTAGTSNLPADQVNGLLTTFDYTLPANFNLLAHTVGPRAYVLDPSYDIVANAPIATNNAPAFETENTYNANGTLQKTKTPEVDATTSPDSLNVYQYLETTFTYNGFGQLLTATDQTGVVTAIEYGSSGFGKGYVYRTKAGNQTISPLVTEFEYNSVGQVKRTLDPRGNAWLTYYNQLGQVARSETPQVAEAGNAVYYMEFVYDLNGNLATRKVSNIDENGTPQSPTTIDTTYAYNILDLVTSVTEPIAVGSNRTTSVEYDKIYRTSLTTFPEGDQASVDYDEFNRAFKSYSGFNTVNVTRANALIQSEVFFDLNSNVVRSLDGRGNDSHITYDAYDRAVRSDDRLASNANYSTFLYNQAGQVIESTRKGAKRFFNVSTQSYQTQLDQILGQTFTRFDNLGRPYYSAVLAKKNDATNLRYNGSQYSGNEDELSTSQDSFGLSVSRVKYRANGQVEETQDDLKIPTKYTYDDHNRVRLITDDRDGAGSGDNQDEYTYDANGNVTAITARLYDDAGVGAGPHKILTTTFAYDRLNRLIQDQSPTSLTRTFRYNSRNQLVRATDRKGVIRSTEYDLLGRPVRAKTHDVTRRVIGGGGLVTVSTSDVASRTIYDKNSNVRETIDPTGNRTYFRYDLAGRWLQTQHADGGSGTPLKTTAGTSHSLSTVGSTVFHSTTNAYDGNSNLLNLLDENDTLTSWVYDANDQMLTENGVPAAGNPFGIIGETGSDFTYDGLYRAITGKTRDGTGDLTYTDSVFNTLGGLERQRQLVYRAHPSAPSFTEDGTVVSGFDEMGRRFDRVNPGSVSRTDWRFDRKSRPVSSYLQHANGGGGWAPARLISEYKYLGGGLLHSRQTKYMVRDSNDDPLMNVPIVSDFEHDDLLRVTRVRHWRDDALIDSGYRLLGRYDYAYDANSMMRYEARWHEDDDNGTSVTPEEVDFYEFESDNELFHAVYNATRDIFGNPIDLTIEPNWAPIPGFNDGTYSDRVLYARRKSSTRAKVNWSRGALTRTSLPAGANPDSSVAPHQTTSYDTSDDPNATPDVPAGDGNGSRHNYTAIGQVNMTYDKRRNLLADGTREFRYSYNNQLRKVWRKSDGDSTLTGRVAEYREDAFGRQVYNHSHWEMSVRKYLDTRFELDVNVDADGDTAPMTLIDGGMHGTINPTYAANLQTSSWSGRITKPAGANEAHYFDFLVDVPNPGGTAYLGYVSYDQIELRVFANRYELWQTGGQNPLGTYSATTAGRRNIGLRAGDNGGVWVNGTQIFWGISLQPNPQAGFASKAVQTGPDTYTPGLILFENLCYVRGFNRGVPVENSVPTNGTPRVVTRQFDGPRPVTVRQPISSGSSDLVVNYTEDATKAEFKAADGEMEDHLFLPNGRRTTGQVVKAGEDLVTYQGESRTLLGPGEEMPGVCIGLHVDAVGAITPNLRTSSTDTMEWCCFGATTTSFNFAPIYHMVSIHIGQGPNSGPEGSLPSLLSATPGVATLVYGLAGNHADGKGILSDSGVGSCACRCVASNTPTIAPTGILPDSAIYGGMVFSKGIDHTGGVQYADWDIDNGLTGWDPDTVWKLLGEKSTDAQAKLQALLDAGWKFATKSDGTTSISSLEGNTDNVDVGVSDGDWNEWWVNGGDGQWEDDKWGVSFDSKLIYIDHSDNAKAMEILYKLLSAIEGPAKDAGKNIDKADFHSANGNCQANFMGWRKAGGIPVGGSTPEEARWLSQLGSNTLAGMRAVGALAEAAFTSIYGALVISEVGAVLWVARMARLWWIARTLKLGRGLKDGIVLGKWPGYLNMAKKLNLKAFDIGALWNKLSPDEQWLVNQKFLDDAIASGNRIMLSVKPEGKNLSGVFRREIEYLISKGYRVSDDGTEMVKAQ